MLDIQRLPRSSPFLNVAENVNCAWKAEVKPAFSAKQPISIYPLEDIGRRRSIIQYLVEKVKEILCASKIVVTDVKCRSWLNHTYECAPLRLAKEHIEG